VGIGNFTDDDLRQPGVFDCAIPIDGVTSLTGRRRLIRVDTPHVAKGVPSVVQVAHVTYLPISLLPIGFIPALFSA
jgi:hypothetical protein